MTKIISEDLGGLYRHLPEVPIVVTAHAKGKDNAMAAAWHMPISLKPRLYGVAIYLKHFTYQLIADSKEFGINFLPFEEAELVASVGTSSGREIDKFQKFNIALDKPVKTAVPILKDAYAAYECKLVDDKLYSDHRLLVGEIVAEHWLEEVFTPGGTLDLDRVSPILFLGQDVYLTTSKDTVRNLP